MEHHSIDESQLIEEARSARKKAFAPYSEYPVGAALLCDGDVYQGSNVEVSGRTTSVHAEMMAVFKAVMDSATSFDALAVSPDGQTGVAICGLCQHTVAQFTDDIRILEDTGGGYEEYQLAELIGSAYSPSTRHADVVEE
jgi:cytidine deaminase